MWQNLIIVIADEVSAMIDHAMKEIPAAALLYLLYYYREISNLLLQQRLRFRKDVRWAYNRQE